MSTLCSILGWLEPILERFTLDMNVLVMPRVAAINKDTLKMWLDNEEPGGIGGFNWNMDFNVSRLYSLICF